MLRVGTNVVKMIAADDLAALEEAYIGGEYRARELIGRGSFGARSSAFPSQKYLIRSAFLVQG